MDYLAFKEAFEEANRITLNKDSFFYHIYYRLYRNIYSL